jgi:predicted acetyltransferase
MNVELVEASMEWAEAFLAMVQELRAAGETMWKTDGLDRAGMERYVAELTDARDGRGLQEWQVPMTTFWFVRDRREVVGTSRIRHRLTPVLRQHGGHIGFLIRPSCRRMGLGRRILAEALARARAMGLQRVLITCDADNVGSRRIIEANGGQLEAEGISPETEKMIRRYWIELLGVVETAGTGG